MGLFVCAFYPIIVRDRIKEAEDITRQTFRDQVSHEPDSLTFSSVDRKTGSDG